MPRYLGARALLMEGISPYAPEVSEEAQRSIYGRLADPDAGEDIAHFAYPLPVLIFVGPFSLFDYPIARSLWMTLLQICLPVLFICGIRISRWRPGPFMTAILLIFSVIWYFGFRAMILGQFAVVEAVLVAAGLLLVRRDNDLLAGVFFGLSIIKPQVTVLLIPLILLWGGSRQRWVLVGSTLGSIILLVAAFMVLLPNWPIQWMYQVLDYPTYTSPGSPVSIMVSWLPRGQGLATVLMTFLFLLLMLWTWFLALGKSEPHFQWTAGLTLIVTQLIAPRTATTNFLVFVPSLMLIFAVIVERWTRRSRLIVLLSLVFMLLAPWLLFLATVTGDREHPILHLPFPLLLLGALLWIRRWMIRRPTLLA
ncbi:MAG: glycosyltransferase family 87 protein [Anaerolineales bacterium]